MTTQPETKTIDSVTCRKLLVGESIQQGDWTAYLKGGTHLCNHTIGQIITLRTEGIFWRPIEDLSTQPETKTPGQALEWKKQQLGSTTYADWTAFAYGIRYHVQHEAGKGWCSFIWSYGIGHVEGSLEDAQCLCESFHKEIEKAVAQAVLAASPDKEKIAKLEAELEEYESNPQFYGEQLAQMQGIINGKVAQIAKLTKALEHIRDKSLHISGATKIASNALAEVKESHDR